MRRIVVGTGVAVGLVVGPAPLALAASVARLSGKYQTRVTVTSAHNVPGVHKGRTGVVSYRFNPKCAHGACRTLLIRHTLSGSVGRETMNPVAATGKYFGIVRQSGSCVGPKGKVIAKNGYRLKQTLSITPRSISSGFASAFSGVAKLTYTPTATARARGCRSAGETFRVHSV